MNPIMRSCQVCFIREASLVYVLPDPYYGYGHFPRLCCDTCKPSTDSTHLLWYESHKYDPERDDYHLGFTTDKPIDWAYHLGDTKAICYDCNELIKTFKRGHGSVYESVQEDFPIKEIQYCQPCFRLRKGNGKVYLN